MENTAAPEKTPERMGLFYLLRSKDKEGKEIYAQMWNNGIVNDELSYSSWAEISYRCLDRLSIFKLKALIGIFKNFMNDFEWEVVKYEMIFDQISFNKPKERINYVNLLFDSKEPSEMTLEEEALIEEFTKEKIQEYGE